MKKRMALLIAIFFIQNASFAQTTYTWNALVAGSASNGLNWLPLTGPPANGDNVLFNGTSTADCTWDIATINSFSVLSGYTGNINMGSAGRIINGNLVINSGSVLATSGDLEFLGTGSSNFILGGTGIFNDNSSNVNVSVQSGQIFTFSGAIILNQLTIQGSSSTSREINFGSNLTVDNLIMDVGNKIHSYQGTIHIKNSLDMSNFGNVTYTTVPTNNTANFIFDGSSALIEGVINSTRGPLPNIEINTTGTYAFTGNVNVTGNWTGTQGTLTIGSSIVNMSGTSAAINGTAAAFDNLNIQSGAVVSMPSNAEVKIGGSLTRTGTLNFQSTTALGLNAPGTTGQTISGTGFTLAGIKAYGSGSARNVTISAPISVLDSIKIGADITFASGGNITLKSSSTLKARVAEIPSSSSITGNVTVETFIPGGTTGWANMGTPGVAGQTVKSWDTYSATSGANGIPMTCGGCDYDQTALGSWFESIQGWDESTNDYDTNIVSTTPLSPGKGFWVYVGDGQSTTNNLKVINTGALVQGPQSILLTSTSGTAQGLNLVANPYACPISWTEVLANDPNNSSVVNDVIYVWNADAGQTTSYVSSTNLSSHSGTTGITDVIPSGQGFYVEYTGFLVPNLSIYESMKTFSINGNTGSNPLLRTAAKGGGIQTFRLKVAGAYDWDETAFCVHSDGTNQYDKGFDARKFFQSPGYAGYPGAYTKYTSISSKDASNEDYSINTIPPLTSSVSIPVLVRVSTTGTYTISAKDFQNFTTCVGLIDKLDNSYHDLRSNPYACTINDTTSAPRFELVLCRDQSLNLVSVAEAEQSQAIFINQDQQSAYVKTEFAQNTKAVISAFNILGQKLMEDVLVEGKTTTTRLNLDLHNQVVIIQVRTDKESSTKKIVLH